MTLNLKFLKQNITIIAYYSYYVDNSLSNHIFYYVEPDS